MAIDIVEKILEHIPNPTVITDSEIKIILQGTSDDQRYGIIKRALASGKLIRLKRGLYYLNKIYQKREINLFEVADKIYGPSYISFQSALSFHGWIPEAVYTVTSASINRTKTFHTPLGLFSFLKIPEFFALTDVDRKVENGVVYYLASPWRALLDYIFVYKKSWNSIHPLLNDMRIEMEHLKNVSIQSLLKLSCIYKSRNIDNFIYGLKKELIYGY